MKTRCALCGVIWLCLVSICFGAPSDSLEAGFRNPPDSAKPHTWWHWMNGNITKEGITADLEAMKQIGLGGATIVNVDCDIPRGNVPFMSPEWRADFKFAMQEADRLGFKLCVENCAGWSSSGGPWNTPANAMQCLTSSETETTGPSAFDAVLAKPPFKLDFYRDVAVLAFKAPATPAGDTASSVRGKLVIKHAVYGAPNGGGSKDVTSKIAGMVEHGEESVVASNDEMGGDPEFGQVKRLTVDFTLDGKPSTLSVEENEEFIFPYSAKQLVTAHSRTKTAADETFVHPPRASRSGVGVIPEDGVIDLTSALAADGRLKWNVPEGKWIILRIGYTPTGVNNHPAPKEGLGLECDKLSKAALDAHWDGFMQKVLDDIGPLAGKALDSSLIDSYEVGGQDWTANFREEFKKRRGYDPLKFLPTFTHRVVESPAATERFLWDMRRTVADLFAENYYRHFAELCHEHGLKSAVEPYTGPFDSTQCGAPADVVMGEFWTGSQGHPSIKLAASIAHAYGKTIVGAESFTASSDAGRWQNDPYSLKILGDLMYCHGLNRYYFHRYAMQPWTNRWPGMTMGPWGIHFERTETWWRQGKAWIDYISRCEFLLQQGRAVADAAYFNGESAPMEMREGNPSLPEGYDFDAVDADVLRGATVKNGRITLKSGANYAVLILPPGDINMTPPTLREIRRLVRAGATVVGPRPEHSPSLEDYPRCDSQVKELAQELWGKCDGTNVFENGDGKGRIVWGKPLADVFAAQNLKPDFEFTGLQGKSHLAYAHRVDGDTEIYFVSNQRREFDSVECTFRVSGKVPELWHSDTGVMEPAPIWEEQDGRTKVRLDFEPAGSVFVIFHHPAKGAEHIVGIKGDTAKDGEQAAKLQIQHAVYGGENGGGEMDVTAKLVEMASDGQLVVAANNGTFGKDPAHDEVKELRVDYTIDGKPGHAVIKENETLMLPKTASTGVAPLWETMINANGAPEVRAWADGDIELSTSAGRSLEVKVADLPAPEEVSGAWNLSFPPGWGAPPSIGLDQLISWTESTNSGVRYFSGTATYEKEISISAERLGDGKEVWLDLGTVKNFAEVSFNGQSFGVLWKPPFRVNVTSSAKPGANKLVVKVTNLWPNRLIGDEQLPSDREWDGSRLAEWPKWLLEGKPSPTGRVTFTTWHHWSKDSRLLESGLIGPVAVKSAIVESVQ